MDLAKGKTYYKICIAAIAIIMLGILPVLMTVFSVSGVGQTVEGGIYYAPNTGPLWITFYTLLGFVAIFWLGVIYFGYYKNQLAKEEAIMVIARQELAKQQRSEKDSTQNNSPKQ